MSRGKKRMSGKRKAAVIGGIGAAGGIAGASGYGIRKYANANPGGRVDRARNMASEAVGKVGASIRGFGGKVTGSRAGIFAGAHKGKIGGGLALFGASALGAAYYAKSKKSRKTRKK